MARASLRVVELGAQARKCENPWTFAHEILLRGQLCSRLQREVWSHACNAEKRMVCVGGGSADGPTIHVRINLMSMSFFNFLERLFPSLCRRKLEKYGYEENS
jgi:hypothetical protein